MNIFGTFEPNVRRKGSQRAREALAGLICAQVHREDGQMADVM